MYRSSGGRAAGSMGWVSVAALILAATATPTAGAAAGVPDDGCVACHGSTDVGPPKVTTMRKACRHCHNRETGTAPKVPRRVGRLMYRLFLVHRYTKDVRSLSDPDEATRFFAEMDPRMRQVEVLWHTFDLDRLDPASASVFEQLRARRAELRARRGPPEVGSSPETGVGRESGPAQALESLHDRGR